MSELISPAIRGNWILSFCPSTGEEVVGSGWSKQQLLAEMKDVWWRCPACQGWHIQLSNCPERESGKKRV